LRHEFCDKRIFQHLFDAYDHSGEREDRGE
jgi:hypothetical protein